MGKVRKPLPDYGYRLNINEPEINELFQRYKKWKGIPVWCPLSDGERHEFEFMVLRAMQKKQKERVKNESKVSERSCV